MQPTHSTRLSALLDAVLEASWLAAIVVTPLFFNIYSDRVFEPDKLTTLRSIALLMAAVWLLRWVEERASGEKALTLTWRTPLVLPTLFVILVYLVSTALSVNPYVSFFGSYQRLQGTFTTLSYIVVFLVIAERMRTRAQVDRFVTTLILNSLPIALYGFVQHAERDALPWGGDVTRRIASNMGNAIFVAAYLIMAVPPTLARIVDSFRAILTDEDSGTADVLRAAAYIFIFLVQIIAIWYTRSRGPQMGLLAGLAIWAFLGLLALQAAARRERAFQPGNLLGDIARGLGFGVASLAGAGAAAALVYFAGRSLAAPGSDLPQWGGMLAAALVIIGAWLTFIVNRRGWRWLWISALLVGALFAAGFLVVNLYEPVREWSQQQPWLGRLDDVLQAESGTGKVRALLWEQALDLVLPHQPIEYPPTTADPVTWTPDPFNAVRPLVGYGPESMFVAANRFYPPLLAHYESRTASGDRAHNETLDALVITGLLGFVAYVWVFGTLFYFGARWLGLLPRRRRAVFFAFLVGGTATAAAATSVLLGPHFLGLAIPVGTVGGLFLYLVFHAFDAYRGDEEELPAHPHLFLLTGILSVFVAHLIEINFGIAIAATRTTFWALAGVFVLLGLQRIVEQEDRPLAAEIPPRRQQESKKRRRRRAPRPPRRASTPSPGAPTWLWPALGAAFIGTLVLGTLAYDFVSNLERLDDPLRIVWRSLTVIAHPTSRPPRVSLGILMVVAMAWGTTGLLSAAQMAKRGAFQKRSGEGLSAVLVILVVSLAVGTVFALALAGRHVYAATVPVQTMEDALQLAEHVAGQVGAYYVFLATIILLGGLGLAGERALPERWVTPAGALALLAGALSWVMIPTVTLLAAGNAPSPFVPFALGAGATAVVGTLLYALSPELSRQLRGVRWTWLGALVAAAVLFLAPVAAHRVNLHPIQADIVFKEGSAWERQDQWAVAVRHHQRATELAPREGQYYLYLGRALLEYATSLEGAVQQDLPLWEQDQQLRSTEYVLLTAQAIDPLNTDHSANLARMYRRWSELSAGQEFQRTLMELSSRYYESATGLSPNNALLWNEWAMLYHYGLRDESGFERTISYSLELDPGFEQTWLLLGDVRREEGDLEGAAAAYERALDIKARQPQVWSVLGQVYLQLEQYDEAIAALSQALEQAPSSGQVWDVHRLLSVAYFWAGLPDQALAEAQLALELAPEEQRALVEQLIQDLQQPIPAEEAAP
jgi:tetratricopeptide (TPR) repeat protein